MRAIRYILLPTIIITVFYLLLFTYLRNINLINATLIDGTPMSYKFKLFSALIQGLGTSMTAWGLTIMLITGFLTGLNLTLVWKKIVLLKQTGKIHFVAGGSSLLAIVGGGCASCGLPVLSLLGLGGSVLYLPFKGAELPYISLGLLAISLFFLLRNGKAAKACSIEEKTISRIPAEKLATVLSITNNESK